MPVRKLKPTSPGVRGMSVLVVPGLSKERPLKALTAPIKSSGGRNNNGRITTRWRGGGHKRIYRIIDFKRTKRGIPATVQAIEYDPNRSCNIALLFYADGEKAYILAPEGVAPGDRVEAGEDADIRPGNALPIRKIPLGSHIHNIELKVGKGGQMVRSAGIYAQLMAKEGKFANIKLPSGEVRLVHLDCYATVGVVGNHEHENVTVGKAGRSRWMGRMPGVRGVVMNPVDHPHGGGEGRSKGGNHPSSPWGQPAKGYRTRKKKKHSSKYIVSRKKR